MSVGGGDKTSECLQVDTYYRLESIRWRQVSRRRATENMTSQQGLICVLIGGKVSMQLEELKLKPMHRVQHPPRSRSKASNYKRRLDTVDGAWIL